MTQASKPKSDTTFNFDALLARFAECEATVAILGMGYVGFPLAIATHGQGYSVLAYDIDASKIDKLNKGESYLRGLTNEAVTEMNESGRFKATSDATQLAHADVLIMCVPTPLGKNHEPDLSYVESTTQTIASVLRPGQLVVLESTTYPGTTQELLKPMLEKTGFKCGEDFFLAYSPEREDPGNGIYSTHSIPKVVGADDDKSRALAKALYQNVVVEAVEVSSAATAEAVKLTENIFRSVNIALVNELKMVFSKMDIDVWEVINAAKTKPFGFMPFYPGPGVGGHCIPIDPFYLTWKSKQYGMPTRFIELAGQINEAMPDYVIKALEYGLETHAHKTLGDASVLLLGMAYKKNVEDMRESPALILFEKLQELGIKIEYYDPYVPEIPHTRKHDPLAGIKSITLSKDALKKYDAVLIATDHDDVDYALVAQNSKLIIDTRNVAPVLKGGAIIIKA